jgi:hypothetical protein
MLGLNIPGKHDRSWLSLWFSQTMKKTSFPGIAVGPSGIPTQGATAQLRCSKSKMSGLHVSKPKNLLLLQM